MTARLQWGILSTGGIARSFAADLRQSRTGQLVAVGSRGLEGAQKFTADFGGRAHGSYEALLADPEVQAVYIATPHPWHAEWAIRAAAAGKHILCEKPLTLRAADTERVIAAAKAHGVLLAEAFMYRFHPQTRRVIELVRHGSIGELRLIRASFNVLCPFNPAHRMFNRALGGGAILDLGCYPISYARHVAGAVIGRDFAEPVRLQGAGTVRPDTATDDFATAVAEFPRGVIGELTCGSTVRQDQSVQLYGTRGWIDVPHPYTGGVRGQTERIHVYRTGVMAEEILIHSPGVGLYAYEADAVADALRQGLRQVPLATWEDTLGTARALDRWLAAVGVTYD